MHITFFLLLLSLQSLSFPSFFLILLTFSIFRHSAIGMINRSRAAASVLRYVTSMKIPGLHWLHTKNFPSRNTYPGYLFYLFIQVIYFSFFSNFQFIYSFSRSFIHSNLFIYLFFINCFIYFFIIIFQLI